MDNVRYDHRSSVTVTTEDGATFDVDCYGLGVDREDVVARLAARGIVVRTLGLCAQPPNYKTVCEGGQLPRQRGMIYLERQHHFFTPGIGRHDEWKILADIVSDQDVL